MLQFIKVFHLKIQKQFHQHHDETQLYNAPKQQFHQQVMMKLSNKLNTNETLFIEWCSKGSNNVINWWNKYAYYEMMCLWSVHNEFYLGRYTNDYNNDIPWWIKVHMKSWSSISNYNFGLMTSYKINDIHDET